MNLLAFGVISPSGRLDVLLFIASAVVLYVVGKFSCRVDGAFVKAILARANQDDDFEVV